MPFFRFVCLILIATMSSVASAQERRPIPYPVTPSNAFADAIDRGTRTPSGRPGPSHWRNDASYRITASIDAETRRLQGRQTVVYNNNSPYMLDRIYVHLYQNLHQEGAARNRTQQVTGGIDLEEVSIGGNVTEPSRGDEGFVVAGSIMMLRLPSPLQAGQSIELGFRWSFEIPEAGAPRMGHDGQVFFLGYWYPQIAVFDDVEGWVADPYLGEGEFYMGFADYQVEVEVPDSWLVSATGALLNADDVLSEQSLARLRSRDAGGDVVQVVTEADIQRAAGTRRSDSGRHVWRFEAEQVRDFAFGASASYAWDSAIAVLPGETTTEVHALYRPAFESWQEAAEFGRFSLEFMSERFETYPWPHMSILEGIIQGGMEYPMITLIGSNRSLRSLFGTTLHEVVHMWFPMFVNQDEKRYTWMDEGLTSFLSVEGTAEYWGDDDGFAPQRQPYYRIAGSDIEVESMRHADRFPIGLPSRGTAHYSKPAVAFNTLRHIIGEERFWAALQEYAERWAYRHPYPWDLFNTFNDVTGENLDWFWRSVFFETWVHDLAIDEVVSDHDAVRVLVEDLGLMPMPATVRVTYDDGMEVEQVIPVDVWLEGERLVDLEFPSGEVDRVEIDPDWHLPDVDRTNNVWKGSVAAIGG